LIRSCKKEWERAGGAPTFAIVGVATLCAVWLLAIGLQRGATGDLVADTVLGQRSFTEIAPNEVVAYRLANPQGVGISPSGAIWVWDFGNNRIGRIGSTGGFDRVLGQPDLFSAACNGDSGFQNYPVGPPASSGSLCSTGEWALSPEESGAPMQPSFDSSGAMFTPDVMNNRVLKYCDPDNSGIACGVWGQPDFASRLPVDIGTTPPTDRSLRVPVAADISAEGWLAVADCFNQRIVIDTDADGQWDLVLGQDDFVTGGYWSGEDGRRYTLFGLAFPSGVRFWQGGDLFVSDNWNERILRYRRPFVNGMVGEVFANVSNPRSLTVDPLGRGLWVTVANTGAVAQLYSPSGSLVSTVSYGGGAFRGGIAFDSQNRMIAAGFFDGHDVVRFADSGSGYVPEHHFFAPAAVEGSAPNHISLRGLWRPHDVEIAGQQIVVADGLRIVVWNDKSSIYDGKPSDFAIPVGECDRVSADAGWLWTVCGNQVSAYALPLTASSVPAAVLVSVIDVAGGGQFQIGSAGFYGLEAAGGYLYLSQPGANRAFRVRDPLTAPTVDVLMGQTDIAGTSCNRGLYAPADPATPGDMLCYPGGVRLDRHGNLFLSDHSPEVQGNFRQLVFSAFPDRPAQVIFAPMAVKIFPPFAMTFEPAFDSSNRMFVGVNPYIAGIRFVEVFDEPLGPETMPDEYLSDFGSWTHSITFDDETGDLYVLDGNRNRLLRYRAPYGSGTPVPTSTVPPVATDAPTPPPSTPTLTPSLAPMTPTPTPTPHGKKPTPRVTKTPKP
jgi:hypothetical protein